MDKFLTEMLKMEDINTDQVINLFHLNEMNKAQLNELCLFEVLQELCKKCLILNEEIFAKFVNMTVTSNKETLHRLINDYINEIKTLGTNENEKLSKYRHEILSKLEKLL